MARGMVSGSGSDLADLEPTAAAELYDPPSGRWSQTAPWLRPDSYSATLPATDAAKNSSKPQTIAFRVIKR